MNIALSPELEKLIEAKIMSGRYHSATEVIGEALYLLEQQDDLRDLHSGELQTRLDQGPFCSSPRRGGRWGELHGRPTGRSRFKG
jgi:putative addiction module CopG family antidote